MWEVLFARCVYKGPPEEFIDPVKQEEERLAKLVSILRTSLCQETSTVDVSKEQ